MSNQEKIVICGAGGFIGGHLIADLRRQGYTGLRAVDKKPFDEWYQKFDDVENLVLDLQEKRPVIGRWPGTISFTIWRRTWAAWALSS
jgi:nucleoside-diphosphate-sugar epimerase